MSAPGTAAEFLGLVRSSGLLDASLLDEFNTDTAAESTEESPATALARDMVERKLLTDYQARVLLAGVASGFYIGKYKILELLGRGGMGHVFLAEHVTMQRLVAVKVVNQTVDPESSTYQRFVREARAIASLRHPNIIHAYDFDETAAGPFIVMEYIEGLDVAAQVRLRGTLPVGQAADFVVQAAEGLAHAHAQGFVHRDIKPGNLLVDSLGIVRLLDLGLVSDAQQINRERDGLTAEGHYLGTLDYIAPEQAIDSRSADVRSDIYSLGAVLYFMLSGRILFPETSAAQKLLFHQTKEPDSLATLRPELPAELVAIVNRMLAKQPEDRIQTAVELADAVRPFAARVVPPFDVDGIGFRRDLMDRFLRHSPSSAGMSVSGSSSAPSSLSQQVGSSESQPAQAFGRPNHVFMQAPLPSELPSLGRSGEDETNPVREPGQSVSGDSYIYGEDGSVVDVDFAAQVAAAGIPSFPGLGSSSASKPPQAATLLSSSDSETAPAPSRSSALIAVVALLAIASGLVWHFSQEPADPRNGTQIVAVDPPEEVPVRPVAPPDDPAPDDLGPTPDVVEQPPPIPDPAPVEVPPTPREEWTAWIQEFQQDPDLLLHLTFREPAEDGVFRSEAEASSIGAVEVNVNGTPERVSGRWPETTALRFAGPDSGQYLALDKDTSKRFNLDASLSVSVWFRVNEFSARYQALVAKGDFGFRMARMSTSRGLAFAINRYKAPTSTSLEPRMAEASDVDYHVDDGAWHQAVGVVDASDGTVIVRLYVDGEERHSLPSEATMSPNGEPVLIAANSFFLVTKTKQTPKGPRTERSRQFSGDIDEVSILSRALTAEEIRRMFSLGMPR